MESNPEELISNFLNEYRASNAYSRDRIARLAELATSDDAGSAESATRAFFTLVERLADSFDPDAVSLYNRVFAQVIQACRTNPRAADLDHELEKSGLRSEEDLLGRVENIRKISPVTVSLDPAKIRRVVILSRVTLGADVAITSVIIERIKLTFPAADIVFIGGAKTPELFGGDPRLQFVQISYRRGGTTIERLNTWIDLLCCVQETIQGLTPGEYLIVDPDSRLTQLGVLPIETNAPLHGANPKKPDLTTPGYLFFPSREYGAGTSQSLSELTSSWLDEVFGEKAQTHPHVSLAQNDINTARNLVTQMKQGGRRVVALNFGVGENPLKRVGGDFEAAIVAWLIGEGAAVVLDKGASDDEKEWAGAALRRVELEGRRLRVREIDEQSDAASLTSIDLNCDILVWNGRIGMLAALIGECNLYIGYDSAGSHIATALGIPCIDVFAGFGSSRFVERWRPTGAAESKVIAVDPLFGSDGTNEALSEVLRYAGRMLIES